MSWFRPVFGVLLLLLAACSSQPPDSSVSTLPRAGTAEDVLINAIGLVGTPYRWGGNTPESGFDCSGLIGYVYREAAGVQLPRTTQALINMPVPMVDSQQLRSGDLVFFATAGGQQVTHAGIYVGNGRFVHAPRTGGTVRLDYLSTSYWQRSYLGARRILGGGLTAQRY